MSRPDSPEFAILGSSSSGNAYVFTFLQDGFRRQILVECGFPYKELLRRALLNGVRLSETNATLVTHCHGDHAVSAYAVNEKIAPVFASKGTLDEIGIKAYPNNTLVEGQPRYIAVGVQVYPFLTEHDAPEPMGFVIRDEINDENILFVTDAYTVKADLSQFKLDYIFVECNYLDRTLHIALNQAEKDGDKTMLHQYRRVLKSHMGLYGCKKFLHTLNLSYTKAIFLIHLSDRNARSREMKEAIMAEFPNIPVYVCRKNGSTD